MRQVIVAHEDERGPHKQEFDRGAERLTSLAIELVTAQLPVLFPALGGRQLAAHGGRSNMVVRADTS